MTEFIQLSPDQATPELKMLINPADPALVRCQAVLDGQARGSIFTDHPETPSWVVVQEASFGSIYLGGEPSQAVMQELVASLNNHGDVLVGLWQDDPRWSLFQGKAEYSGSVLEFSDREPELVLPAVPEGCSLKRLDATLSKEILGRNFLIHTYGSIQKALEWGYGLCLLRDSEILCETFAGPSANGVIELGVETYPHHVRKGYAYITCVHLAHLMESQGYLTYWNCDKNNLASAGLARKLGYSSEKEYRLLAWLRPASTG